MNYKKIYNALVEKAKVRGLDKSKHEGYFEIHHIVPRCLGGNDEKSNLVMFTGQEHYLAHMLLWKAYPENVSLMRAAHIMSSRWGNSTVGGSGGGINSKVYSKLRAEYAQAVSVQCSGENNPMYGVTHSPEILEKIKNTRRETERKKRLVNWKDSNEKYMSQFKFKKNETLPFLYERTDQVPVFRFKGALEDWLAYEVFRDFWERLEKTGAKDFCTKVNKVSGKDFNGSYFNTMVKKFVSGQNLSENSDYIVKALNNNSDSYIEELTELLSKTPQDLQKEYIDGWMSERESNRGAISKTLEFLDIKKHKNNSKARFSLVDVTEALILWKSGFVEQKFLAELYGVARNSVSNALEVKERWLEVKDNLHIIEGAYLEWK